MKVRVKVRVKVKVKIGVGGSGCRAERACRSALSHAIGVITR